MKEWITKEIVDDPDWQEVRKGLVGNWKKKPNECCLKLSAYLDKANANRNRDERLLILRNYLTGSAFRIGVIDAECAKKLRTAVSAELNDRKEKKLVTARIVREKKV
jgi:hypothetical protein